MRTETAAQNKKERLDRVLELLGVRMIGGEIAEIPEKGDMESNHGGNDRRRTENIMQDIH